MHSSTSPSKLAAVSAQNTAQIVYESENLTRELCDRLDAEWSDLASNASERNIFQFPWYIRHSLALLSEHSPQLVTIRERGILLGLMILRRDIGYAKLPVPFLRTALHHEQFLGTPLVRKGSEEAFAAGLCAWLDNAPGNCSFVNLSMITANGPLALALKQYCAAEDRQFLIANRFERAAIVPAAHAGKEAEKAIESQLRPARRKSLRRSMKNLQKQGEVSVEQLSDGLQLDEWIAEFLAMENTGWKRENASSILSCPHETKLYKALIAEAFTTGDLHFSRLCLDNRPIAYTLDIAAPPVGFCLKSAIDQGFRKFSPGVLIELETLKYYIGNDDFEMLDSCSAPSNAMLNEIWPDRQMIMDIAIARKGGAYGLIFHSVLLIKSILKSAIKA